MITERNMISERSRVKKKKVRKVIHRVEIGILTFALAGLAVVGYNAIQPVQFSIQEEPVDSEYIASLERMMASAEVVEETESMTANAEAAKEPESMTANAEAVGEPESMAANAEAAKVPGSMTANAEAVGVPESMTANAEAAKVPGSMTANAEAAKVPGSMTANAEAVGVSESMTADAETRKSYFVSAETPADEKITVSAETNMEEAETPMESVLTLSQKSDDRAFRNDSEVAPGCYSENGALLISWDFMIAEGFINVEDGMIISVSEKLKSTQTPLVLVLPEDITSIGKEAFSNFECLARVMLPRSVSVIGENAFAECVNLQGIDFL